MNEISMKGIYPDLHDTRDLIIGLPEIIDGMADDPVDLFLGTATSDMIMDQGQNPYCAGYTGAILVKVATKIMGKDYGINNYIELAKSLYRLSREFYPPSLLPETGSSIRNLMKALKKEGFIENYYRIDVNTDDFLETLKASIQFCQVIPAGFHSTKWNYDGKATFDETVKGAHALPLVKFNFDKNDVEFGFLNSWGPTWGNGGFGSITPDHLIKSIFDPWIPKFKI